METYLNDLVQIINFIISQFLLFIKKWDLAAWFTGNILAY